MLNKGCRLYLRRYYGICERGISFFAFFSPDRSGNPFGFFLQKKQKIATDSWISSKKKPNISAWLLIFYSEIVLVG
jgi:hypothetical protein